MKQTNLKKVSLLLVLMIAFSVRQFPTFGSSVDSQTNSETKDENAAPYKCSVFTLSKSGQVFFGGNDDYINPDSYYWVDPGDDHNFGVIWIGEPDNVQQGVNERGLAYDANGLPRIDVNPHSERLPVPGDYTSYPIHIMHECTTVEEVITWINTHRWHSYMHDQMQFADATGDAVIISAGKDGEVAFTRKQAGDGFLVSTNFNVVNPSNGFGYPCWRYDRATEMLGQMISQTGLVTVLDAASVLDAVHQDGGSSWTISSMVADLTNGVVYLYYFYQFDRPVVLNVKEELANPRAPGPLSKLFPDDVQQEAASRYHQIQVNGWHCKIIGIIWIAIVLISLIIFLTLPFDSKRKLRFWIPALIILGIPALLVWLLSRYGRKDGSWRTAILESMGDLMPTSLGIVIALVVIIMIMISQGSNWILQVVLLFGIPLLTGGLVFHGSLLAPVTQKSYGHFIIKRMAHLLTVTNLGIAGIFVVALPLINKATTICTIFPISFLSVLILWVIVVLGSLVSVILLFLYNYWAYRKGFQAWSVLVWSEGEVTTPSWRDLCWWIILSYITIFLCTAAGALLNQ